MTRTFRKAYLYVSWKPYKVGSHQVAPARPREALCGAKVFLPAKYSFKVAFLPSCARCEAIANP